MQEMHSYDVAIVGAGPAGCTSALSFARRGKRVLLLEAEPRVSDRLAGEWLHPPALTILDRLGVDLTPVAPYATGKGFVLFPCDGSEPIALPYATGHFGIAIEHALLVETLRAHCEREPRIDYRPWSRATRIEGQSLTFERRTQSTRVVSTKTVSAPLIVGASGRPSTTGDWHVGVPSGMTATSRMAGLVLSGSAEEPRVNLPFEGYLHVFLGGPGPVMAYRIDARRVRLLFDVPLSLPMPREGGLVLYEAYGSVIPAELRRAFRDAVRVAASASASADAKLKWASIDLRPRVELGREGLALVGDAVGTHHPLAATDLTLALEDADTLARMPNFSAYARTRMRQARVPEMLAVGLYEVFADDADEVLAIRRAIYELWREQPRERLRSMGFLAGTDRSHVRFGRSFLRTMLRGSRDLLRDARSSGELLHKGRVASDLGERMAWLFGGTLHLTDALPADRQSRIRAPRTAEARYGAALRAASAKAEVVGLPRNGKDEDTSTLVALRRGAVALTRQQADDGSFEGEVSWSPVLTAQYVLAWHAMGRRIAPERRANLLVYFERTRLPEGTWGLHEQGEPDVLVTTLVYIACRLLGIEKDEPTLRAAYAFIRREGAAPMMPIWGKVWLAIVGLHEWEGIHPFLPEVWRAPRWLPIHPSRYHAHTRLVSLAISVICGETWRASITPEILALRDELYPRGYDAVEIDMPSTSLQLGHRFLHALSRAQTRKRRARVLAELREQIRDELRSTYHMSLSPMSGLLDQLALHMADPEDSDLAIAGERFEGWIWEDAELGARVTGVRSAIWDTSFAGHALAAAAPHIPEVGEALAHIDTFLVSQQLRRSTRRDRDRIDPAGGYCFAGVWQGWPLSDCTAEAMLARIESKAAETHRDELEHAARFVLRCQNTDGGFGRYESRRLAMPLDWIDPAALFRDAMTERSSVECTASCIAALSAFTHRWPESLISSELERAIARATVLLRRMQRPDGSWTGTWGIHFVYGTMFGIRGLLAGGVPRHDPQVRRACTFLLERQRPDGAWGEHHSSAISDRYIEHEVGQVVQTAWAMSALLLAKEPDFVAIERAAQWLIGRQAPDGTWARQGPAGISSHGARVDYALYHQYFPLLALALYETRRAERARFRRIDPLPTSLRLEV